LIKKYLHIILICLLLSSCDKDFMEGIHAGAEPFNMWRPKPPGIGEVDPNAPPNYKQGWNDGCDTGLFVYGGDHYRYLGYKVKQDYKMINNEDYYNAWQDAYLYCRWYIWNYIRKGDIPIGFTEF